MYYKGRRDADYRPENVLPCRPLTLTKVCCLIFCRARFYKKKVTSCRRAAATICRRPSPPPVGTEASRAAEPTAPTDRNVAVGSHAQCVPRLTAAAAWRVNAAVSKAAWWPWRLTFWPWKWCPNHVWRGHTFLAYIVLLLFYVHITGQIWVLATACASFILPRPLCSRLSSSSSSSSRFVERITRRL